MCDSGQDRGIQQLALAALLHHSPAISTGRLSKAGAASGERRAAPYPTPRRQHETKFDTKTVVRPENRRAERARQGLAELRRQGPDDLGVNINHPPAMRQHHVIVAPEGRCSRAEPSPEQKSCKEVRQQRRRACTQRRLGAGKSVLA